MSVDEQNRIRETCYCEALRYMDNAREYLKNAQKEGSYYHDIKIKPVNGKAN